MRERIFLLLIGFLPRVSPTSPSSASRALGPISSQQSERLTSLEPQQTGPLPSSSTVPDPDRAVLPAATAPHRTSQSPLHSRKSPGQCHLFGRRVTFDWAPTCQSRIKVIYGNSREDKYSYSQSIANFAVNIRGRCESLHVRTNRSVRLPPVADPSPDGYSGQLLRRTGAAERDGRNLPRR